jgi:DNA-binding NtrC family response regulator
VKVARILVVEDDDAQRETLVLLLADARHEVEQAASAEAALDLLHTRAFDLIIADYQLSGATGAWLAHVAKTAFGGAATRAMLITGHDYVRDSTDFMVVRKPIDVPLLLTQIDQALAFDATLEPPTPRDGERIAFVLFVSDSAASRRTESRLRALFAPFERSQIALNIVNLSTQPSSLAEEHRIVATPTLLKIFPAPRVWIAGELKQPELVARLLEEAGVEAPK